MKKEELSLTNLKNAIDSLIESSSAYKSNEDEKMRGFIEDSCVKRFEFTVETSWKIMKKFLKLEYGKSDAELTMNNIFRFMEGYNLISSWESWKNYYNHRNNTSHEYNQDKAQETLKLVDSLIKDSNELYNNISKKLD